VNSLENAFLVFPADADSRIRNGETHRAPVFTQRRGHAHFAGFRELDGIGNEVAQNLASKQ